MANSNPVCATICTDIYFEVTGTNPYTGGAIVDVLEYTCSTGGPPGGEDTDIEVFPMTCMELEPGMRGWAKLVQTADDEPGDCFWRAYSLCCAPS